MRYTRKAYEATVAARDREWLSEKPTVAASSEIFERVYRGERRKEDR
jgi:hypothetical protein